MEKNGTPASPATARASSVLPVPGGPKSSTPFGIFAPIAWNFAGSSRNSLISWSSSTASSSPATSAKVDLRLVLVHLPWPGLAELHDPAAAALHRFEDEEERRRSQHERQQAEEQRARGCPPAGRPSTSTLAASDLSSVSSSAYSSGNATVYFVAVGELARDLVRPVVDGGRGRPCRRRACAANSVEA